MSGSTNPDVHDAVDASVADAGRPLPGALRSTWHLWVGVAFAAALTAIPLRYDGLGSSGFGQLLFGSLTAVLAVVAVYAFLKSWSAVDVVQA